MRSYVLFQLILPIKSYSFDNSCKLFNEAPAANQHYVFSNVFPAFHRRLLEIAESEQNDYFGFLYFRFDQIWLIQIEAIWNSNFLSGSSFFFVFFFFLFLSFLSFCPKIPNNSMRITKFICDFWVLLPLLFSRLWFSSELKRFASMTVMQMRHCRGENVATEDCEIGDKLLI